MSWFKTTRVVTEIGLYLYHASKIKLSESPPNLLKSYPVAAFALSGLLIGCFFLLTHPPFARIAFGIVAIVGGIPLVIYTVQSMFRCRFHVDPVATLPIIGYVALGEYASGALVVLMRSGGEALERLLMYRLTEKLGQLELDRPVDDLLVGVQVGAAGLAGGGGELLLGLTGALKHAVDARNVVLGLSGPDQIE